MLRIDPGIFCISDKCSVTELLPLLKTKVTGNASIGQLQGQTDNAILPLIISESSLFSGAYLKASRSLRLQHKPVSFVPLSAELSAWKVCGHVTHLLHLSRQLRPVIGELPSPSVLRRRAPE